MSPTAIIIVVCSLLWNLYLTYLVYTKNAKKTTTSPSETLSISEDLRNQISKSIQKTAIVRFNPFDELGGDQSFVLALLDNSDSGVIITSLHNRDNTRIYAKPIKNGESDGISLSREEKMVILKAIKG